MKLDARIEAAIGTAISLGQGGVAPPKLASALQYAVTPGGARIRPTILLSVALACGDEEATREGCEWLSEGFKNMTDLKELTLNLQ